jgi:hypothetical protein
MPSAEEQKYPRPKWSRRFAAIGNTSRDVFLSLEPEGRTAVDVWAGYFSRSFGCVVTFELWAVVGEISTLLQTATQAYLAGPSLILSAQGYCPDRWDVRAQCTSGLSSVAAPMVIEAWGC